MLGSSVLDVAVGIVFIFLLLSVFATAVHELLFSFLNMRGRALLRGIGNLVNDPEAKGLAAKIYTHGQVFGLYDGDFDPGSKGKLPSYIPARNFALALMGSVEASFSEVKSVASLANVAPAPGAAATPAMQEVVVLTKQFKDAVTALATTNEKVGKPLLAIMNMAGNDAAKMQRGIEEWFNSGMDRVSGKYKYYTQWTLFYIGLAIALGLNASSTRYVTQLSRDSTLRASLVAQAGAMKPPSVQNGSSADSSVTQQQIKSTEAAFSQVNSIGVPLGWHHGDWDEFAQTKKHMANIAIGWLVTAIAISLGAPFWFDILNKIMVIRSTVKPREKSHDEGSKD